MADTVMVAVIIIGGFIIWKRRKSKKGEKSLRFTPEEVFKLERLAEKQ